MITLILAAYIPINKLRGFTPQYCKLVIANRLIHAWPTKSKKEKICNKFFRFNRNFQIIDLEEVTANAEY